MNTIPTQRGRTAEIVVAVFSITLFIIGILSSNVEGKVLATVVALTVCTLTIIVSEVILRTCLVCEEIFHLQSRYEGIYNLLEHAFTFSKPFIASSIALLFSLLYIYQAYDSPLKVLHELGGWFSLCCLATLLFYSLLQPRLDRLVFSRLMRMDSCCLTARLVSPSLSSHPPLSSLLIVQQTIQKFGPLYQAITIGNLNGLDYGSAMAYSFFHGYLQIVLPDKGTGQTGIKELIKDFEAKEGVTFGYNKLLVLIPLSLHCPATVGEKSNIVESSKSLGDIVINRAGVNKRVYKNTAYKIKVNSREKMYVCLEYATPLQTLHDIVRHRHKHTNDYALQRKELVLQFYLTCQTLLNNDPDCKDCCDLIFFDDKTENGDDVDVGVVVLDHINKSKCKKNQ